MIVWPKEAHVNEDGREGLRRFRQTGACAEFEYSTEPWHIVAWPWSSEMPLRIELASDRLGAVDVLIDDDGLWRFEDTSREIHERSIQALEQDAEAAFADDAHESEELAATDEDESLPMARPSRSRRTRSAQI
ncbi:MAG: hypothetical protein FWD73_09625 [Polyangiaceae bacterium]|nr:hypothetical protein [Polyangiaceae bacterium]